MPSLLSGTSPNMTTGLNHFNKLLENNKKIKSSAVFKVVDDWNHNSLGKTKKSTLQLENFSLFKRLRLRVQALWHSRFQKNTRTEAFHSTIVIRLDTPDVYRQAVTDYQDLFLSKYRNIAGGEDLLKKIAPKDSRFLRKSDLEKYASQITELGNKSPAQFIVLPYLKVQTTTPEEKNAEKSPLTSSRLSHKKESHGKEGSKYA